LEAMKPGENVKWDRVPEEKNLAERSLLKKKDKRAILETVGRTPAYEAYKSKGKKNKKKRTAPDWSRIALHGMRQEGCAKTFTPKAVCYRGRRQFGVGRTIGGSIPFRGTGERHDPSKRVKPLGGRKIESEWETESICAPAELSFLGRYRRLAKTGGGGVYHWVQKGGKEKSECKPSLQEERKMECQPNPVKKKSL